MNRPSQVEVTGNKEKKMGRTSKKKLKKKDKEVAKISDWPTELVNWTERMRQKLTGEGEFTSAAKGGPIRMHKGGAVDARKIAKKYFKGTF